MGYFSKADMAVITSHIDGMHHYLDADDYEICKPLRVHLAVVEDMINRKAQPKPQRTITSFDRLGLGQ